MKYGFSGNREVHFIEGINIYPPDYFSPINFVTGEKNITERTHSIHHYTATWYTKREADFEIIKKKLEDKFGSKVRYNKLLKLYRNVYCYGLRKTMKKVLRRIKK